MQTIDYGYRLPESKEYNFWEHLIHNITRLASHKHDGVSSAKLKSYDIDREEIIILAEDWGSAVNGIYSKEITVPSGYSPRGSIISFKGEGGSYDGLAINCDYVVSDADKITVSTLDNTIAVKVIIS